MKTTEVSRLLALVSLLASAAMLRGQDWEAMRFKTNSGWTAGGSLEGQRSVDPAGQRWYGNDPYDDLTGRGAVSYLTFLNYYTDSASGFRNPHRSLILGGGANLTAAQPILPGVTNPTLFRRFTPREFREGDQVRLAVDFSVIDSLADSGYATNWPARDTFSFELRDSNTGGSLAKFSFRPEPLVQGGVTNRVLGFYWTKNGQDQLPGTNTGLTAPWAVAYHALYRLEVILSGSSMDVLLSTLSKAGPAGAVTGTTLFIDDGRLAGATMATNFNTFALAWELSSTNLPPLPGYNYIAVHDVSVTSGVNTWLKNSNLPLTTSLAEDPDRNGLTLLQEYASGAAAAGGAATRPVPRLVPSAEGRFLEITAPIRTNDWRLATTALGVESLSDLSSILPVQDAGAGTGSAPPGAEERVFRMPVQGRSSGFFRLRFDLAP